MKIAVIGCGRIAWAHLKIYRLIEDAEVVAVSDVDAERGKAFAAKSSISSDKVFTDYTKLMEIKDLDLLDVCTPPSTHADIVCDAAEHGHSVLLEKPMALSTDECDRMIHEVKKNGIHLCICHNQIFFPAMRKAKQLVDSGYLKLVSLRTSVRENPNLYGVPAWNTSPKEKGIIWEVGCHPAYLQLHFLGNVTEVYAVGNKAKYPVFDEFSVLLRTAGRPCGIMEVSWLAGETEKVYEINDADGKRAFMISPPPIANEGYDTLLERSGIAETSLVYDLKRAFRRLVKTRMSLGYYLGHFHLISSYMKSLTDDMPSPVQPEEGKKTVALLESVEESLNTHKAVEVHAQ
jgi:UDP-N-acetylglucosamine 3-dehydrogenase